MRRVLALVLFLSACAIAERADSPVGMSLPELVRRIQIGEPVLDRLPPPDAITVERQQNRHDPAQTDTVRRLAYPGLLLTVYQPGSSGKVLIAELAVTGGGYRTAEGLQVGSTLQQLSDAYGEADLLEGDEYVYQLDGPLPTTVRFRLEDERITRMQWEFYID